VFTFSVHGEKNFPAHKEVSDLDVALSDGTEDSEYLEKLGEGLDAGLKCRPQLVIYLAGADPFKEDRFGRLSLSKQGLAERDRLVLDSCTKSGLPIAVTMAGGYSRYVRDTVDIHYQTVKASIKAHGSAKNRMRSVFWGQM
jgi:acetoin utilization deacetylase AcuC-like enzyme